MTVTALGSKKETIVVVTNTTARVDGALTAGSASEIVTATAAPPLLQTARAGVWTNLEQRQIANLF